VTDGRMQDSFTAWEVFGRFLLPRDIYVALVQGLGFILGLTLSLS
jgi:hypothetical protein